MLKSRIGGATKTSELSQDMLQRLDAMDDNEAKSPYEARPRKQLKGTELFSEADYDVTDEDTFIVEANKDTSKKSKGKVKGLLTALIVILCATAFIAFGYFMLTKFQALIIV